MKKKRGKIIHKVRARPSQLRKKETTRETRIKPVSRKKIVKGKSKKAYRVEEKSKEILVTDVDRLVELVNQKKSVSVSEAAKFFSVKKEQVEEWGRILDEGDILNLHYPAIGHPVLRIKDYLKSKKNVSKHKKNFEKHYAGINKKRLVLALISFIILVIVIYIIIISI